MSLSAVDIIPLKEWCQPADDAAELLQERRANLIWQAFPGESFAVPPPDLVADPADIEGFNRDGRLYLVQLTDGRMTVDPVTLARLHGARVRNGCGSILLRDSLIAAESYHNAWILDAIQGPPLPFYRTGLHLAYNGAPFELGLRVHETLPADQVISGAAVLIDGRWSDNYCHWMIECLPRLWCLDALPALRDLPVIVPGRMTRFHQESLEALGIGTARQIPFTGHMLSADTLYVPSCLSPAAYGPRQVAWLRDTLRTAFGLNGVEPDGILYVSRSLAGGRRILDEESLVARLRRRAETRVVFAETMSLRLQIEAFAQARLVVSSHGAGMTNTLFCSPGTAVIECLPAKSPHPMYGILGMLAGLRYGRILCPTVAPCDDLLVDPGKLDTLLDQAGF